MSVSLAIRAFFVVEQVALNDSFPDFAYGLPQVLTAKSRMVDFPVEEPPYISYIGQSMISSHIMFRYDAMHPDSPIAIPNSSLTLS